MAARCTQKSFRLYHNQDAALIDWLEEFAARYKQSDLIRLALYTLAGLDMPPELDELNQQRAKKRAEKDRGRSLLRFRPGFVYLMRAANGHYKIGMPINPESRAKEIAHIQGENVELVSSVFCADRLTLEARLHERYQNERLTGEWFALSEDDAADFEAIARHENEIIIQGL